MIVGPNWKPRKFSDAELDVIEQRGRGDLEEFSVVLCRAIGRMDEADKATLRASWLDYVAEKERTKENDWRFLKSVGAQVRQRNPDIELISERVERAQPQSALARIDSLLGLAQIGFD